MILGNCRIYPYLTPYEFIGFGGGTFSKPCSYIGLCEGTHATHYEGIVFGEGVGVAYTFAQLTLDTLVWGWMEVC